MIFIVSFFSVFFVKEVLVTTAEKLKLEGAEEAVVVLKVEDEDVGSIIWKVEETDSTAGVSGEGSVCTTIVAIIGFGFTFVA